MLLNLRKYRSNTLQNSRKQRKFAKPTNRTLANISFLAALATALFMFKQAVANEPPRFFQNSLPEHAMEKMLQSYGALQGEGAALDTKTRELIALGVSAQLPCEYCVYAHRRNALQAGASEAELREAVATAGFVRLWSAMFQGAEIDPEAFKAEHDKLRAAR